MSDSLTLADGGESGENEPLDNPSRGCGHLKPGKSYIVGAGFSEGGVLPSWVELDPYLPYREIGTSGEFTRGFEQIDGLTLQMALEAEHEFIPHYPGELRASTTREEEHEEAIENHLMAGVEGYDVDYLLHVTEADRHAIRVRERGTEGGSQWGDVPTAGQSDLLMRAGESYYPEPEDFAMETTKHGLSKAIPVTPSRDPPQIVSGITRCWIMHPTAPSGEFGGRIIGYAHLAEVTFTEPEEGDLPSYIEEAEEAGKLNVRPIGEPEEGPPVFKEEKEDEPQGLAAWEAEEDDGGN